MKNALLFTDNATIQKLFSLSLEKKGMNLIKADLENPQFNEADVIFVDSDILDDNLLNEINLNQAKKVLILGKNEEKRSGFDEYMTKPFLPTDLIELLTKLETTPVEESHEDELKDFDDFDISDNLDDDLNFSDEHNEPIKDDLDLDNLDLDDFNDDNDELQEIKLDDDLEEFDENSSLENDDVELNDTTEEKTDDELLDSDFDFDDDLDMDNLDDSNEKNEEKNTTSDDLDLDDISTDDNLENDEELNLDDDISIDENDIHEGSDDLDLDDINTDDNLENNEELSLDDDISIDENDIHEESGDLDDINTDNNLENNDELSLDDEFAEISNLDEKAIANAIGEEIEIDDSNTEEPKEAPSELESIETDKTPLEENNTEVATQTNEEKVSTLNSVLNLNLEELKKSGATITITIKFDKE